MNHILLEIPIPALLDTLEKLLDDVDEGVPGSAERFALAQVICRFRLRTQETSDAARAAGFIPAAGDIERLLSPAPRISFTLEEVLDDVKAKLTKLDPI